MGSDANAISFFFAIPSGKEFRSTRKNGVVEMDFAEGHSDWLKENDVSAVADFVECPKKVVSSLIRLERPKKCQNFRREVIASSATDDVRFQLGCGVGDRKVGPLGIGFARGDSRSVSDLIESGTQGNGSFES
jgi:hypothetical protein